MGTEEKAETGAEHSVVVAAEQKQSRAEKWVLSTEYGVLSMEYWVWSTEYEVRSTDGEEAGGSRQTGSWQALRGTQDASTSTSRAHVLEALQ